MLKKIKEVTDAVIASVKEPVTLAVTDWTITVSDSEGNEVQKFNDLTEAMSFARENGYFLHAE